MVKSAGSHLGRLIREARESRQWSQDELRQQLGLARAISISKWERGEAPVPLHHWRRLMEVLEIPRAQFLAAAKKDRHHQLRTLDSITSSVQDSFMEIGSFTWEVIVKNLAPNFARQLERIRNHYPDLSPVEFARSAWEYYIEQAQCGIDRNNRPIIPRSKQRLAHQPSGR